METPGLSGTPCIRGSFNPWLLSLGSHPLLSLPVCLILQTQLMSSHPFLLQEACDSVALISFLLQEQDMGVVKNQVQIPSLRPAAE